MHGALCRQSADRIHRSQRRTFPGLEALDAADLLVIFARYRELPDEQMKHIADYIESGRPMVGLRTATHAFNYTRHKDSPYAKYGCNDDKLSGGFGRQVLGETWINHYGHHNVESTRATIVPAWTAPDRPRRGRDLGTVGRVCHHHS